jgi:hypothetical protein
MGQLEYGTAAAWAQAVRAPGESAANTNAKPNLPAKIDIRAAAKPPETIRFRHQERQRGSAGVLDVGKVPSAKIASHGPGLSQPASRASSDVAQP